MTRNKRAVTVIELVVGLMIVIPIILVLIDMVLLSMTVQINDSAAREADRLAASGDPTQALSRAQRAIDRIKQSTGGYIADLTLVSLTFKPANLLAIEAGMIPYGGVVRGSVTVTTQATVTPLVVGCVSNAPIRFQASQTCPISFNIPNTAGGQAIPP